MDEPFELPVLYKGEDLFLPAQLKHYGYTYRFAVRVQNQEILFERDEEQQYRTLIDVDAIQDAKIDVGLLQAIAAGIEGVLK